MLDMHQGNTSQAAKHDHISGVIQLPSAVNNHDSLHDNRLTEWRQHKMIDMTREHKTDEVQGSIYEIYRHVKDKLLAPGE